MSVFGHGSEVLRCDLAVARSFDCRVQLVVFPTLGQPSAARVMEGVISHFHVYPLSDRQSTHFLMSFNLASRLRSTSWADGRRITPRNAPYRQRLMIGERSMIGRTGRPHP